MAAPPPPEGGVRSIVWLIQSVSRGTYGILRHRRWHCHRHPVYWVPSPPPWGSWTYRPSCGGGPTPFSHVTVCPSTLWALIPITPHPEGTSPNPPSCGGVNPPSLLVPVRLPPCACLGPLPPRGFPGLTSLFVGGSPARDPPPPTVPRLFSSPLGGESVFPPPVVSLFVLSNRIPQFPLLVEQATPRGAASSPANWVESVKTKKAI